MASEMAWASSSLLPSPTVKKKDLCIVHGLSIGWNPPGNYSAPVYRQRLAIIRHLLVQEFLPFHFPFLPVFEFRLLEALHRVRLGLLEIVDSYLRHVQHYPLPLPGIGESEFHPRVLRHLERLRAATKVKPGGSEGNFPLVVYAEGIFGKTLREQLLDCFR